MVAGPACGADPPRSSRDDLARAQAVRADSGSDSDARSQDAPPRAREASPWQEILGTDPVPWLLASDEPWTRARTLVDLLDLPVHDGQVQAARAEMIAHPQIAALMRSAGTWGRKALKRHNDASHPLYALSTLADFGLDAADTRSEPCAQLGAGIEAVLLHQSAEGAFQSVLNIAPRYGGTGEDTWTWLACDAPTLLYTLLAMGFGDDFRVQRAVQHLASLVEDNGWRCSGGPEVGRFRGPGRRGDPCPIANVYALKALAQVPELIDSLATRTGAEMLLSHWARQLNRKVYLFGTGSDYRKLKYPFVWYDALHVVDVLSQLPFVHTDTRFREMLRMITDQAHEDGRITAGSMYLAWRGWSFANKKAPSPWLTFLVLRVLKRVGGTIPAASAEQ